MLAAVQQELLRRGGVARVTACSCLGPCFDGPNAVIYPDDIWYGRLETADAEAIVEHLLGGVIYATKRLDPPGD